MTATLQQYAVGIDIGGTYIKSGLVAGTGEVIRKERWPIRKNTREEFYQQFEDLIQFWRDDCTDAELIGIGIGIPGFINHKTGVLDQSPNLPVVNGAHIFDDLNSMLSLPAVIDNDANAASWGEYWAGGGRGAELLILLTLGTGIGGGIVWNGEIWHGADGYAGEIGHTVIVPDGEPCNCGKRGCIEAQFSASAMIRDASKGIANGRLTSLTQISEPLMGKHILQAAGNGDELALEIVTRGTRYLGMTIAGLINIFNPDQIVLGGGIIAAADLIMPLILKSAEEHAIKGPFKTCTIRPSVLGNDAGLIGSAGLVWQQHG